MWCWYYRMRFQSALDRGETAALPGHMDGCPACRQWAQQMRRLHDQLEAPAAEPVSEAQIERLRSAVMGQLAPAAPPRRPVIYRRTIPLATAAAVLLLVGLGGLLSRIDRPIPPLPAPEPPVAVTLDTAVIQAPVTRALRLPEASLGRELHLLAADTRRALVYLQNCLPMPPEQPQSARD